MGGEKVAYTSVPAKESDEDGLPKKYEEIPKIIDAPKGFGIRHTQVVVLFLSLSTAYTMRSQLSVSLVAMTTPESINLTHCNIIKDANSTVFEAPSSDTKNESVICKNSTIANSKWTVYRTYNWSHPKQEMILFAFFVGYTTMMMPMGMIVQKYGGKLPILVALAVNGVVSILTPWVPLFAGWLGVCACRLLQGATQSAFYPSIHTLLSKWAPLSERGRLSTYIYTGSQFGTIFIFLVSGYIADSPAFGWPAIFWLCGILSLICFGMYAWLGSASPHDHPTIAVEEFTYIVGEGKADIQEIRTPWKSIITSPAVWGLTAAHTGSVVAYLLVLTQGPTYMSRVLGVDIKRSGLYSSLPYIAMYGMTLVFGYVSDLIINKKIMTVVNFRRLANSIGMMVSAFFLIAFAFVHNTSLAVFLLVMSIGVHSGVHVGFHINHLDIASNFAGPIMAMGNMISNLSSLLVPVLVSNIVKNDVTNQQRWQILFIVISAIQIVTNIIFVIFVKGESQPWNLYGDERQHDAMFVLQEKNQLVIKELKSVNDGQVKTDLRKSSKGNL